ncbi:hypothetical protein PUNSTDRAFT_75250, partial [Punctularia strigosozonata HHB-11173 SS5]
MQATAPHILGWILFRRFGDTGAMSFLDEAMQLQRRALTEMHPSQIHERHQHLRCLGFYVLRRFEFLGHYSDLEEAISVFEESMRLCPPTHTAHGKPIQGMLLAMQRK